MVRTTAPRLMGFWKSMEPPEVRLFPADCPNSRMFPVGTKLPLPQVTVPLAAPRFTTMVPVVELLNPPLPVHWTWSIPVPNAR